MTLRLPPPPPPPPHRAGISVVRRQALDSNPGPCACVPSEHSANYAQLLLPSAPTAQPQPGDSGDSGEAGGGLGVRRAPPRPFPLPGTRRPAPARTPFTSYLPVREPLLLLSLRLLHHRGAPRQASPPASQIFPLYVRDGLRRGSKREAPPPRSARAPWRQLAEGPCWREGYPSTPRPLP
ncbi:formin-like protein 14 [Cricetulus griseus]|uniref:Formin-like protein 14 n=1 Tax=Cricetulus griseus TaxID=10029 RepID=A0A9J7K4H8_CRIGR|nr:formin-like protein 14 [Cricetulus griseus]